MISIAPVMWCWTILLHFKWHQTRCAKNIFTSRSVKHKILECHVEKENAASVYYVFVQVQRYNFCRICLYSACWISRSEPQTLLSKTRYEKNSTMKFVSATITLNHNLTRKHIEQNVAQSKMLESSLKNGKERSTIDTNSE
jgi:hypothetical protein